MLAKIGDELDKLDAEEIKTIPIDELLPKIKNLLLFCLQLVALIATFFSKERKQTAKALIARLKAEQ